METNLAHEEHLLVRKGDIAYNMMRMWQGASGLAPYDAIVSPAYVVLHARPSIDPLFASYFFKSPRMIFLFWAYSYGLTEDRLRLYFLDFSAIPIFLPPVEEQHRISEILSTWDRAIKVFEKRILNAHAQKKALMQQLLTGKRRLPGFDKRWISTRLGARGTFRKGNGVARAEVMPHGIPCVRYGEIYTHHHDVIREINSFITEDSARSSELIQHGDILFTCSGETAEEIGKCAAYVSQGRAYAGSDIIIFAPNQDDPVFLAYLLNSAPVAAQKAVMGQGHSVVHISARNLARLEFNIPLIEEQKDIAAVLLASDAQITNLTGRRQLLIRERSALMQQLLTGKRRVKVDKAEAA